MSKKVNVVILSAVMLSLLCLSVYAQVGVSGRSSSQRQRQAQPSTTATAAVAADANSFTDSRDGQVYRMVRIGNLTWMAQNLNHATTGSSWCHSDDESNCQKFGRLYDWNTAMTACPAGWRLPTYEDWNGLVEAAGGDIAGRKLKSQTGWDGNGNGIDEFDFSALPGSSRSFFGRFWDVGVHGFWWSATGGGSDDAWCRLMRWYSDKVYEECSGRDGALSVRCVQ